MPFEVEELYCNLNKLLNDICKFLHDESNYEKLSPRARKEADELIGRSKRQLQEITIIVNESSEYDGAYVDMERKPSKSNEDDINNIYSSVDETVVPPTPTVTLPTENPYANLSAKDLSRDIKYGPLSWKCRIILKFEKMRRIYAGVHNNWLLMYSSERDCKPLQTLNLKYHKAQNVLNKQGKNLSQDFELICTSGEKKTYYFIAVTHKDMLQWISHINRCYENLNKITNLSISEEEISETYDIINELSFNKKNEEEEEEEIYHDIETYAPNHVTKPGNKAPELPARFIYPKPSLPPLPSKCKSEEELSDSSQTYDPVNNNSTTSLENSFSEDEEDDIYEAFVARN